MDPLRGFSGHLSHSSPHQPASSPALPALAQSSFSNNRHAASREPRSPIRQENRRPSLLDSSLSSPLDQPSRATPPSSRLPPGHQAVKPSKERHTRIRVSGIERNRRDLYVKFDAWSNLTTNRAGHCPNISRAYREFLLFYEAMSANNPHTIVPPVPFPNTSAPNPADDDRLVSAAFQQFFDRLLIDPSLRTDDELRLFLESDFGYTPQTKSRRKPPGNSSTFGFASLTTGSSASSSNHSSRTLPSSNVNGSGGPETIVSVVEEDELSNARLQFRLLEERLTANGKAVENVARTGRLLATAHTDLSLKWVGLSTTETHPSLLNGIRRLGETIKAVGATETSAAIGCLVTLADGVGWCAVEARAGKEVLRNRACVLDEHYASVKKSIEKRRVIERIKASSSSVVSERVEMALDELDEAKKVEDQLSQKAQLISTNLRPALRTHSKNLHDDLLFSLTEHARTQLIYERQILRDFERLGPDIAAITPRDSGVVYHRQQQQALAQQQQQIEPDRQRPSSMIHHRHSRSGSSSVGGGSGPGKNKRIGEMAKGLVAVRDQQLDGRQRVDAKSAAASLARLF